MGLRQNPRRHRQGVSGAALTEVRHAATVLRRDDETELIGVALLPLQEVATLGHIVLPVVELAGTTVTRYAIAHDVVLMRARSGEVGRTVPGNACLNDNARQPGGGGISP